MCVSGIHRPGEAKLLLFFLAFLLAYFIGKLKTSGCCFTFLHLLLVPALHFFRNSEMLYLYFLRGPNPYFFDFPEIVEIVRFVTYC